MFKLTLLLKLLPHAIKNWRLSLITILMGFIFYQNTSTKLYWSIPTLPSIKTELAQTQGDLLKSADGNKKLATALDKRNNEILQWQATTKVLETQNMVLQTEIEVVQDNTSSRVNKLLKQKTPKSCQAAFKLLANSVGDIKWEK